MEFTFGINPAAKPFTIWIVKRSPDLSPDSFVEIYPYHGPTDMEKRPLDIETSSTESSITVKDLAPPADKAFDLFEAELA